MNEEQVPAMSDSPAHRGDFLVDFYLPDSPAFESWAQARRACLRRRLLEGLGRLADHHLQGGGF